MDRPTSVAGRLIIVVYAFIGFTAPLIVLGCIDALRLYLSGFPQSDLQQDIVQFPRVAIPIAITCAVVLGIAGLAVAAIPNLSRLRVVTLCVTGSAIAAGLYECFRPVRPMYEEAFLRGTLAIAGAYCTYVVLRRYASVQRPHPPDTPP